MYIAQHSESVKVRHASLCLPNEDVEKRNLRSGASFRETMRGREGVITRFGRRTLTKSLNDAPDLRFRFPTSLFGRHLFSSNETGAPNYKEEA